MNHDAELTGLLTVAEAAHLVGVHHCTVRRWIASGDLPALKLGMEPKAPVRVPVAALVERLHVVRPSTKGRS
jgi:excisionase family DNA binding protein